MKTELVPHNRAVEIALTCKSIKELTNKLIEKYNLTSIQAKNYITNHNLNHFVDIPIEEKELIGVQKRLSKIECYQSKLCMYKLENNEVVISRKSFKRGELDELIADLTELKGVM